MVLEDALCELLMMHPPEVSGLDQLKAWAHGNVAKVAEQALSTGQTMWSDVLWKSREDAWDEVELASLEERLLDGLGLFFEEVSACFAQDGGPYLNLRRTGEQPFDVPEPAQGSVPVFPLPEKVRDVEKRTWASSSSPSWSVVDAPITWHEAWECARPVSYTHLTLPTKA